MPNPRIKQRRRTALPARSLPIAFAAIVTAMLTLSACSTPSSGGTTNSTSSSSSGTTQSTSAAGAPVSSAAAAAKSATCSTKAPKSSDAAIAAAQALVIKAAAPTTTWDGPTTGSKATKGKTIVFIAANATNQGDIGVYNGLKQAAGVLGWTVKFIDGQNSTSTNLNALTQAIALKPDAIAVTSIDAKSAEATFAQAKSAGIPVIGNHTGEASGFQPAYPGEFTNISSDPALISKIAAACAVVASNGTAGVVVQGCGSEISLCLTKENAMKDEIQACSGCTVLGTDEYPFENIQQREAGVATADLQRYGTKLTYLLSINDLYWDAAIPALSAAGVGPSGPPQMIAAGDGSPAAFDRIRHNQYQIATVAEPLNEHGWQMADEIVRALAGAKPSTFVTYPHLVTTENVNSEGGDKGTFDPANGYQQQYKKIWGVTGS